VVQFLPFNRIAYHAGESWWEMQKHVNNFSIGIELDNIGRIKQGHNIAGELLAHWRRPEIPGPWETFTPVQIDVASKIVKALAKKYGIALNEGDHGIRDILGHDEVNILNREDPGPAFTPTMEKWRQELFNGRTKAHYRPFYLTRAADLLLYTGAKLPNETTRLHDPGILPAGSEVTVARYDPTKVWTKISVKQSKQHALRNRVGWVSTGALDPILPKGIKVGRQMDNHKKGTPAGNKNSPAKPIVIRQCKIKKDQLFYEINGGEPTPGVHLPPGTEVRLQQDDGKWMLVVVMDVIEREGHGKEVGLQGWVKKDSLSETKPVIRAKAIPAALRSSVPLWQHKDDEQLSRLSPQLLKRLRWKVETRPGKPVPAVFPFEKSAAARVDLTKEWQFFIRVINYKMPVNKVSDLFGNTLAFCNFTGFKDPAHPRADFLRRENLSAPLRLPQFDKPRTCALSVMTGQVKGEFLIVEFMNGSQPPPLKPGGKHPQSIEEIDTEIKARGWLKNYQFTPRTHRHLFFAANRTARGGKKISPLDPAYGREYPEPKRPGEMRGAVYDWIGDGKAYAWLPHVAPAGLKILYPLAFLTPVPPDAPIPPPYKGMDDDVD
jgi:N-acetylmuramoyl-L-alanine amidase